MKCRNPICVPHKILETFGVLRKSHKVCLSVVLPFLLAVSVHAQTDLSPAKQTSGLVDTIVLGDSESEESHNFSTVRSEVVRGGLDQSARRLLQPETESWEGGAWLSG